MKFVLIISLFIFSIVSCKNEIVEPNSYGSNTIGYYIDDSVVVSLEVLEGEKLLSQTSDSTFHIHFYKHQVKWIGTSKHMVLDMYLNFSPENFLTKGYALDSASFWWMSSGGGYPYNDSLVGPEYGYYYIHESAPSDYFRIWEHHKSEKYLAGSFNLSMVRKEQQDSVYIINYNDTENIFGGRYDLRY